MKCKKFSILEYLLIITVVFFLLQTLIIWIKLKPDAGSIDNRADSPRPRTTTDVPICYKNVSGKPLPLEELLAQVTDHSDWSWLVKRMRQQWPLWMQNLRNVSLSQTRQLRVLVIPGLLISTDFARNKSVQGGGPVGDLVQWADLILGLHYLGHKITLMRDFYQAARGIRYDHFLERESPGCPAQPYDLIYTDISAFKAMPDDVREKARCHFRVLDAYGTEAMYNNKMYALKHGYNSPYGQLDLNLKQFYTFYPHSPDNSFLGFAVAPADLSKKTTKQNIGLLYGKDPSYFKMAYDYIQSLHEFMDVHSTVGDSSVLPQGVHNHGVLSPMDYKHLLIKSKFLICVGEPLESTGVIEALSHGCIILNPLFTEDDSRRHMLQQQEKPTHRTLSSQVPYLEHIGPPHVFTLNTHNFTEVHSIIKDAKEVQGYIPFIFSIEGFVKRLHFYMTHQEFCVTNPSTAHNTMFPLTGMRGESCSNACRKANLVCDSAIFKKLTPEMFSRDCTAIKTANEESIFYPAMTEQGKCVLPASSLLYSCAGEHHMLARLCACRKHNALVDP